MLLERARVLDEAQVEILESLEVFPSTLPTRRESAYAAWVSISVGCNNTCTFCIVPALRGVEKDRRPGDILAEVRALVGEGVLEVTLLGQNVNSYGVEFGDRGAFAKLLRACGEVPGLERVRFTSPHPKDFTDDVIEAMATTANVMPQLHMPLQSGSDTVLRRMRRSYRRDRYLGIIERVRAAMPDAAITTDVIVGFPGETEADFEETLDVVRQARFAGAFTFQYSIRPGTPAATMDEQVPKAVVQERYERLVATQDDISWAQNRAQVGRVVEVLVARGRGPQGRCHAPPLRPGRGQPARARRALRRATRRRRHRDGDVRRAAPPGRGRPGAGRPPHPRRRCLAGPDRRPGAGAGARSRPARPARPSTLSRTVPGVVFCPCPPLLVPAVAQGAAAELAGLRATCDKAVAVLVDGADAVTVVGPGPLDRIHGEGAGGTLAGFGVPVRSGGPGAADLPLSLAVGAWLLDRAPVQVPRRYVEVGPDGSGPAGRWLEGSDAVLVMGDGTARLTDRAPGGPEPGAAAYDDAMVAALGAGDPAVLAALDPGQARTMMAAGVPAWRAVGAALADLGGPWTARLLAREAPYGVSYVVAHWQR